MQDGRIAWPQIGQGTAEVRSALAAGRIGTWRWDATAGVVYWDAMLEALCGLEPGSFGSSFDAWMQTLHADDREWIVALVEDAIASRSAYRFEHRAVWPDGTIRWLECRGEVTTDEHGTFTGTTGCAIDVTERRAPLGEREGSLARTRELNRRLANLARLNGALAAAADVADVGRILVEDLESNAAVRSCGLWLTDNDGALTPIASRGLGVDAVQLERPALELEPLLRAHDDGRTVESTAPSDEIVALTGLGDAAAGDRAVVAAPVALGDHVFGVLVVAYDRAARPELGVSLIESIAGHAGQALARAQLAATVADRAAKLAAVARREQRRREQLEFLAGLTRVAVRATGVHQLMREITDTAIPRLGDWCSLHFRPDGSVTIEETISHTDPAILDQVVRIRRFHPHDPGATGGVAAAMRSGESELVRTVDGETLEYLVPFATERGGDGGPLCEALGLRSMITVPLITARGVVGAMQFSMSGSGRHYGEEDLALAEALAGRIADALENRSLADRHREVATSLQRALLPPELPDVGGLQVAHRYLAAGSVAEVGGDFYDLFRVGDGRWVLVVGDVCGTGPDAAATTAIARHTTRAAARHGHDPHEVLEWVNQAVLYSDRHLFCTMCYSTIEAVEGRWRMAVSLAGHPPPVVCRGDGTVTTIGAPGTLLGVLGEIRNEAIEMWLDPGDLVVFYTDGLTDLPPPYGIDLEELCRQIGRAALTGDANTVADRIIDSLEERVPDEDRRDDVALAVVRVDEAPDGGSAAPGTRGEASGG